MTYNGEPSRNTNNVLKVLVVISVIWVAFWASTGGLEAIPVPEQTSTSVTSTTLAG